MKKQCDNIIKIQNWDDRIQELEIKYKIILEIKTNLEGSRNE